MGDSRERGAAGRLGGRHRVTGGNRFPPETALPAKVDIPCGSAQHGLAPQARLATCPYGRKRSLLVTHDEFDFRSSFRRIRNEDICVILVRCGEEGYSFPQGNPSFRAGFQPSLRDASLLCWGQRFSGQTAFASRQPQNAPINWAMKKGSASNGWMPEKVLV